MGESTQEKNLIQKEEKGIFNKIKKIFKNLFGRNKNVDNTVKENNIEKEEHSNFKEYIKMTEDEETQLLELQRKYRAGEIAENDLTDEQIDALSKLYDKQIEDLKKSIALKEQKIAEYKKKKV